MFIFSHISGQKTTVLVVTVNLGVGQVSGVLEFFWYVLTQGTLILLAFALPLSRWRVPGEDAYG